MRKTKTWKKWQHVKKFFKKQPLRHKLALGLMMAVMIGTFGNYQLKGLFNANILETPEPFDGTVYPMAKVPDWTRWSGDNKVDLYSSIPEDQLIPMPAYDIEELQGSRRSTDKNQARNAQVTYSVVYMASYEKNHEEYTGSHLAVDIRVPTGTPIQSIANGKVIEVSEEGGSGHHIVVQHPGVPDPENPDQKTTLYSSYAHLSEMEVEPGEIVKKGQQIGKSGQTGIASSPHLHFQIDNNKAPWHPYWSFTGEDMEKAGVDFFEAVNMGIGIETAKEYTINPMPYIQKYLNYDSTSPPLADPADIIHDEESEQTEPELSFELEIGSGLSEENRTTVFDLSRSKPEIAEEEQVDTISEAQLVNPEDKPARVDRSSPFADVPLTHPYYHAIEDLHQESILHGYEDGTYLPDEAVNRVEAVEMLVNAFDIEKAGDISALPFFDIDKSQWYASALATAYERGIVKGFDDGRFLPTRGVKTSEFLKMLFETNGITPPPQFQEGSYTDVPSTDWVAGYAFLAKKQNLIDRTDQLEPEKVMTRAEVAESIYRMKYILENGLISYVE